MNGVDEVERTFIKKMAGGDAIALINEQQEPLEDFVHPLTHSIDVRKHPDMQAIPMSYTTSRFILKKFKKLKRIR